METLELDFDAARVKRIRILLGETQAQFAERVSVSPDMVRRWETGKAEPMRGPVLKALLDAEAAV
jgi:DNA-binding transcriptional regulator YiaG